MRFSSVSRSGATREIRRILDLEVVGQVGVEPGAEFAAERGMFRGVGEIHDVLPDRTTGQVELTRVQSVRDGLRHSPCDGHASEAAHSRIRQARHTSHRTLTSCLATPRHVPKENCADVGTAGVGPHHPARHDIARRQLTPPTRDGAAHWRFRGPANAEHEWYRLGEKAASPLHQPPASLLKATLKAQMHR